MKMNSKVGAALALTLVILLFLSGQEADCQTIEDVEITALYTSMSSSSSNSSGWNIAHDDEAEITRRILAGNSLDIGKALQANRPICNAQIQSNCIGLDSKFYEKRACDYKNVCRREKL